MTTTATAQRELRTPLDTAEARPVAEKGKARLPADPRVSEALTDWTQATLAHVRAPIGEATGAFQTYHTLLGDTAALEAMQKL